MRNLKSLVDIVPDLDTLILRAGDNELLPDAHIKTCDLLCMVLAVDEIKLGLGLGTFILRDVHSHDLLVLGHEVDIVFLRREGHRRDREVHVGSKGALGV